MAADDAYWKVTVREAGGKRRAASYEVHTNTQLKAEAAAEKEAARELGGRWIAVMVRGPQGGPFRTQ